MAIIVAGWVVVIGATAVTLYLLTPPKPAPMPVTPATVGPDAPPVAVPPVAGEERVYTAPGAPLPPAPGMVPAPPPQTFTAPGVAPMNVPPGAVTPGAVPSQNGPQPGAPPPNMQPQSGPARPPMGAPPRIAANPDFRPGGRPMPLAPPNGNPLPMLPPPPSMGGGNRPSMPSGPMPQVNVPAQRAFEAGGAALRAGDKNQAAAQFARAVQIAPGNLPSRLNLASVYLDLNQPGKAVPHLREVVKRDPNNAAVQFTLARALLADKKLDEALPHLRKTVQLAPQERQAKVILAQVLFDTKKPAEAYKQWSALAQSNPKDIEAQMQSAALAGDVLKQPAQAEKWLRRAVAAAPKQPQPALMLGQVLLARKDAKGAAQVLSKAAQNNPDAFAVYPLLADARTAAGDTKGAAQALQSALAKLPAATKGAPPAEVKQTEGALRLALGRTLGASKQTKEARAQFERAATLLPRDPQPRALGAVAALQLKDNAGAIKGFKSALALDPKRLDDRKTLAQLLADGKQWKEADAQFALYTQSKPNDAEALMQWSQVAAQLKDPKRAAQVLGRAVKVAPRDATVWTRLALAQRESGDKRGALASFNQLNKLKPNNADALYETARLQSELGDNTAAFANFKKVVDARPQAIEAYPALLEAASKAGQSSNARQFLARELAEKENGPALKQVLDYYSRNNQSSEARAFLNDLVARAPKQDGPRTALSAMKGAMTNAKVEPASVGPTALPPILPQVNLSIVPKAATTPTATASLAITPTAAPSKAPAATPKPTTKAAAKTNKPTLKATPGATVKALAKTNKPARKPVPSPTLAKPDARAIKHADLSDEVPLIVTKPTPQ